MDGLPIAFGKQQQGAAPEGAAQNTAPARGGHNGRGPRGTVGAGRGRGRGRDAHHINNARGGGRGGHQPRELQEPRGVKVRSNRIR